MSGSERELCVAESKGKATVYVFYHDSYMCAIHGEILHVHVLLPLYINTTHYEPSYMGKFKSHPA